MRFKVSLVVLYCGMVLWGATANNFILGVTCALGLAFFTAISRLQNEIQGAIKYNSGLKDAESRECLRVEYWMSNNEIMDYRNQVVEQKRPFIYAQIAAMELHIPEREMHAIQEQAANNVYANKKPISA
ncbi:MAG: hypothetical protein ACI8Q1_003165 [Parvicella sp.]|jgi:hypothetical protein